MWKLALLLFWVAITFDQSQAACGICSPSSGVACVSKTEFQICVGGKPYPTQNFTCPNAAEVCTLLGTVCVDLSVGSSIKASCDAEFNCGNCAGRSNTQFACTSRNTFAKCTGEKLSEETGICPEGLLCDPASRDSPCKEECLIQSICDKN